MTVTYQQAQTQLHDWTKTDSLLKHARAVEIVMRAAAAQYGGEGADPDTWAIAGLLHDADYEQWPDEHPKRIVDWLREQGDEDIAYAVSFHQTAWGLPPKTVMDKCLIASLEPKSVKKKLKDKAFAAKVDRQIIHQGVELLGVDLTEHIRFVIEALKPHAEELGVTGR